MWARPLYVSIGMVVAVRSCEIGPNVVDNQHPTGDRIVQS